MDSDTIVIVDENGEEKEFTILFTFDNKEKSYVLFYDPEDETGNVNAMGYDEDGNLFEVETPEEWDMIEEIFDSFII